MAYPRGSYGPGPAIDAPVEKPAVVILDMAKGYGWAPGGFGYDMVARVRRLMDAAHTAGVQVVHVTSLRRPTDNLPAPTLSTLRNMAGFRNVLVHGYDDVDLAVVRDVLEHHLGDLDAFVAAVRRRL